jgi:hypothetical protein
MFNSGKTSFPHVSEFNKLLYLLLINIFLTYFPLQQVFSAHIIVLFGIISSDFNCFILFYFKRKGASSKVITSCCGFSAHFFISNIVILVFCTFCVEVQGESAGLSMECVSPLSS